MSYKMFTFILIIIVKRVGLCKRKTTFYTPLLGAENVNHLVRIRLIEHTLFSVHGINIYLNIKCRAPNVHAKWLIPFERTKYIVKSTRVAIDNWKSEFNKKLKKFNDIIYFWILLVFNFLFEKKYNNYENLIYDR